MKKLIPFAVFTSIQVFSPAWVAASEQDLEEMLEMSMEDLLNLTVTVASKTEETLAVAPSSVTVFTRQEMLDMGVTSVEEVLNFVPGFQATLDTDQGRLMRVSARGRSTAFSESVLFLVNGQRLNDHLFGGAPLNNRSIPIENVKQVEVIRGPGSALYGSNAFLGVVNIRTVDDVSDFSVQTGDKGQRLGWVNYAKSFPDDNAKFAAFAKFYGQDGDTYSGHADAYGHTETTRDPFTKADFFATLQWRDWTLNISHSDHRQEDFYNYGAIANHHNRGTSRQCWANLKYSHEFNEKFQTDFSAGWLQSSYLNYTVLIPMEIFPDVLDRDFLGAPLAEQAALSFNIDSRYRISEKNELIAGLVYEQAENTDIANIYTHDLITLEYLGGYRELRDEYNYNDLHSRDIYGVYIQDKHDFNDNLSLTAGLRFDAYSDFGQSINPRAALIYKTAFDSHVKFMYGQAFRAPNFTELYDKNNPVDFGNLDLDAESVETLELAYIQNLDWGQAGLTLFDYTIDNVIVIGETTVAHPDNPLEAPQFANSTESDGRGLEFEVKAQPVKNLMVSANWTHYLNEEDVAGSDTGSLVLNYKHGRFNLNYSVIYRDELKMLPEQSTYTVSNLAVQYRLMQGVRLKATVHNLFDEEYFTPAQGTLPGGVPNPGRSFLFGIHGEFK